MVIALGTYLLLLSMVVVIFDRTLRWPQKVAQCLASLLIPVLGPILVLYMAHQVSPSIIRWVPWPFRSTVRGNEIKRYDDAPPPEG